MTERLTTEPHPSRCPQVAIRPGWHGPCHQGHAKCVTAVKRHEAGQRERRRAALKVPGEPQLEAG